MIKLKKGFTLAEIATALGIVGVVAALTVPQFNGNIQKQNAGSALGRTVTQIETGCQNIIQHANSRLSDEGSSYGLTLGSFSIRDINPYGSPGALLGHEFIKTIYPFLGLERATSSKEGAYRSSLKTYSGANAASETSLNQLFKFAKFPATAFLSTTESATANKADENAVVTTVRIDTNGFSKPNAYGKDIFIFQLTNSCKMVPYGLETSDNYRTNCSNNKITDGKACAARVVTDNYRILY